ncbi:MAG TPA: PQQ-dependent sugar dehydrogenase [Chloroflexia bacterium]|nr:PQQ-dependent sugar dehydrogenase [Chloroflexia bacterium]
MTLRHRPLRLRAALACLALVVAVLAVLAAGAVAAAQPTGAAAPTTSRPKVLPTVTVESLPPGVVVAQVLTGMERPTAMVFDHAGRLFYTEKGLGPGENNARVRLFENGVLRPQAVMSFTVSTTYERGLLGITLDPDFSNNHLVYVYYTSTEQGSCDPDTVENRVVRFVESNGIGSNPETIFTSCQSSIIHVGGNIHFGPDGMLYITIGESDNPANSQDPGATQGKIHRVNSDGSTPADNPVITSTGQISSVFALGLRNSFDFDFDPLTPLNPWPRIFATENGPYCDDELNRIEAGYNYGWRPDYRCDDATGPDPAFNTIPPMWFLPQADCCEAPTGAHVYTGTAIPGWTNELFMCTFNNGVLRHVYLDPSRTEAVTVATVAGVTCNMDIETAPDGALYVLEGGGYTNGTLHKIHVPGAATPTATQPAGTATSTPVPPRCPGERFTDVCPGDYFYQPVVHLSDLSIVSGYSTSPPCENAGHIPCFKPYNGTTRGQISKVVSLAAGFSEPVTGQAFEDVPPGSTFYEYVQRMASRAIVEGYLCGTVPEEPCVPPANRPYFRPNAGTTRGQLTRIVSNSAGFSDTIPPGQYTFADVPPGHAFWVYVERLLLNRPGVMSGYPCGTVPHEPCDSENRPYFRPNNPLTRGQTAKIVDATFFPVSTITFAFLRLCVSSYSSPGPKTISISLRALVEVARPGRSL